MRIIMHKDIFENIDLFKEVWEMVIDKIPVTSMTYINNFDSLRFDLSYDEQREYNYDSYVEIPEDKLHEHLQFDKELQATNFVI